MLLPGWGPNAPLTETNSICILRNARLSSIRQLNPMNGRKSGMCRPWWHFSTWFFPIVLLHFSPWMCMYVAALIHAHFFPPPTCNSMHIPGGTFIMLKRRHLMARFHFSPCKPPFTHHHHHHHHRHHPFVYKLCRRRRCRLTFRMQNIPPLSAQWDLVKWTQIVVTKRRTKRKTTICSFSVQLSFHPQQTSKPEELAWSGDAVFFLWAVALFQHFQFRLRKENGQGSSPEIFCYGRFERNTRFYKLPLPLPKKGLWSTRGV